MAYQSWSVIYGEQPSASKWNILGSNDAHFYSFLGDNTAWQTWTPTYTNFTLGTSTVVAYYIKIGRWVRVRLQITMAAGFSFTGSAMLPSLPVTAVSGYATSAYGGNGTARYIDTSPATSYWGSVRLLNTTQANPQVFQTGASYMTGSSLTSTVPFTWATTDILYLDFSYEAAA